MRNFRAGFTLIELMVSISILAIMMVFLYKSYASLNRTNKIYKKEVVLIQDEQIRKKVIYLDFSLALHESIKIINQDKREDIVFFQSSNSLHKMYNPYIAYILKDKKLYRLESLTKFKEYSLSSDMEFSVDYFGKVDNFRIYQSTNIVDKKAVEIYLVDIDFSDKDDLLLKIKVLNQY